jgi:hypothetical protein
MTIFEPGSNIHILQSEVRKYQHYLESTWMLPDWPNTSLLHTWIARVYIYITPFSLSLNPPNTKI